MKFRWLGAVAFLLLATLGSHTQSQAASGRTNEFWTALNKAWSARSFRAALSVIDDHQKSGSFTRVGTWSWRADVAAGPIGRYLLNMVQMAAGQPLTQTLYMAKRSCLRPRAWLAWGCADTSVDGQITDEQEGWMRSAPFLFTPGMSIDVGQPLTQRAGSRLVDVYPVDSWDGYPAAYQFAVDRATDTLVAISSLYVSLTYHNVWVLRYSDWNDTSIVIPDGTKGKVPLPGSAQHSLVPRQAGAASFSLLWPLYRYPTAAQYRQFRLAVQRAVRSTSANVKVNYIDVDGTHGLFSGLIILNSDHYDVNVTGSVDGRPGVEVAATDTQECVRHPNGRWHCADILGDTRFPLLDDLTVIPFLKAERKGPVLFAGTVVEHGRVLDHYMVLNDVDRVIDVAIDRHTGYLTTVYLHQNALAVYDVQATYSDWNASDVSFPMLPATSS